MIDAAGYLLGSLIADTILLLVIMAVVSPGQFRSEPGHTRRDLAVTLCLSGALGGLIGFVILGRDALGHWISVILSWAILAVLLSMTEWIWRKRTH